MPTRPAPLTVLLLAACLCGGCQFLPGRPAAGQTHTPGTMASYRDPGPLTRIAERLDDTHDALVDTARHLRGEAEPYSYERSYEASGYQW